MPRDDGVPYSRAGFFQPHISQPHRVGDDAAPDGPEHGADAVRELGFTHAVVVACGIGGLHVVHRLDEVVDLDGDDDRQIGDHQGEAVDQAPHGGGGVGEVEADVLEIEGGAAQAERIDDPPPRWPRPAGGSSSGRGSLRRGRRGPEPGWEGLSADPRRRRISPGSPSR